MHRSYHAGTRLVLAATIVFTGLACAPLKGERTDDLQPGIATADDVQAKPQGDAATRAKEPKANGGGTTSRPGDGVVGPLPGANKSDEGPGAIADADVDYFEPKTPKNPMLAGRITEFKKVMDSGSPAEQQNLLQDLCQLGDPDILPYLVPVMGRGASEDDQQVRMLAVRQVGAAFPTYAPSFFKQLLVKGNQTQVESALYAFGTMSHTGIARLVLPYMFHEEEKLRRASTFAMVAVINPLARSVMAHSAFDIDAPPHDHAEDHIPRQLYARWDDARVRLSNAITSRDLDAVPDEVFHAVNTLANHEMSTALVEHFRNKTSETSEKELGETISKIHAATGNFLGRPKRIDVETVDYVQYMYNVMSEKDKKFRVFFDSKMLDVMRCRRLNLDRGMRLALGSDFLMIAPQACKPQLTEGDEGEKQVTFDLPLNNEVEAGVGSMNIFFWSGRTQGASKVVLSYDPETYLPTKEQIFAPEGTEIATVEYGNYQELESGAKVPLDLKMDMKIITAKKIKHMRFEIAFQIVQGLWLYKDSTTYVVSDEGEDEIRAIGEIQDIRILRQKPTEL